MKNSPRLSAKAISALCDFISTQLNALLTKLEDQKPEFQCIGAWLVSVRIFNANGLGIFFLAELKPCDGNYGLPFGSKREGQL